MISAKFLLRESQEKAAYLRKKIEKELILH